MYISTTLMLQLLTTITIIFFIFGTLAKHIHHDYIVVGAGPAGLQMGYFLEKQQRDYLIVEKGSSAGIFFQKYPRHDQLISINKIFTGQKNDEFNFRHDWNSLISDREDLLLKHYSQDYFPHRQAFVDYLKDFATKLQLKLKYNTEIVESRKVKKSDDNGSIIELIDANRNVLSCKYLIIATGMFQPNNVMKGYNVTSYDEMDVDPSKYRGKTVLILGKGNTAFEVAKSLYGVTNLIHMISRSRVKLSWATHYVGDVRGINNELLDAYQLKSLDGILEGPMEIIGIEERSDRKKYIVFRNETEMNKGNKLNFPTYSMDDFNDNNALREGYDEVISCLGWTWHQEPWKGLGITRHSHVEKYPRINHAYEAVEPHLGTEIENVYIIGTQSHSLDYRKSAGGFIHGFRYTTRTLHRLLEWKNHNVKWSAKTKPLPLYELMNHLIKRINEASAIYQMFSILGDVVVINEDANTFEYFEEYPIQILHEFDKRTGSSARKIFVLNFEYNEKFSKPTNDPFRSNRASQEPRDAHNSNFLHPVLYYYDKLPKNTDEKNSSMDTKPDLVLPKPKNIHHIVEDFLTNFNARTCHLLPLRRFLENSLRLDLRYYSNEDCMFQHFTMGKISNYCMNYFSSS